VQALLPECSTAADLGCGDGALLPSLHQRAGRVIGVDHSPGMLRAARQRLGDVDWASLRIGELEHLPLRDAEADAALICMALHHLSHPAEGLTESARTIRPGGTLLVVDFDKHGKEDMRTRHGDRWLGFSEDELAELLREAGLTPLPALAEDLPSGLRLLFQPARKPHEHKET
jgi:ArsR family transcriptional regulator